MTAKRAQIESKSSLAIALSNLEVFEGPKVRVEQYPIDSEIAAEVLWQAYLLGDIAKVRVADLGAGTGILGIGALMLGAEKVYFVESDGSALQIAKKNIAIVKSESKIGEAELHCQDISDFNKKVHLVLQNPPFGTKVKHSDRIFLKKAFEIGDVVYSFHKSSTRKFIESLAKENRFIVTNVFDFKFPLKKTMDFHKRKIHRIDVSCFRFCRREDDKM